MPPPSKAKLHNKTGRLKNLNKTYTNPSNNSTNSNHHNTLSATRSSTQASAQTANTIVPNNSIPSGSNGSVDSLAIEQFELELCWCIQTLNKSLESGKLTAKQAQDTEKTLRSLESNNQPMVKKRQLMRSAFGDYRKKMSDEEKKLRTGNTAIQFIDASVDKKNAVTPALSQGQFVKKSFTSSLGEPNFQFNFAINEIGKLSIGESEKDTATVSNEIIASDAIKSIENNASNQPPENQTASNPFIKSKLFNSNSSFKFNFTVDCD